MSPSWRKRPRTGREARIRGRSQHGSNTLPPLHGFLKTLGRPIRGPVSASHQKHARTEPRNARAERGLAARGCEMKKARSLETVASRKSWHLPRAAPVSLEWEARQAAIRHLPSRDATFRTNGLSRAETLQSAAFLPAVVRVLGTSGVGASKSASQNRVVVREDRPVGFRASLSRGLRCWSAHRAVIALSRARSSSVEGTYTSTLRSGSAGECSVVCSKTRRPTPG